jgi:hypothetical protein
MHNTSDLFIALDHLETKRRINLLHLYGPWSCLESIKTMKRMCYPRFHSQRLSYDDRRCGVILFHPPLIWVCLLQLNTCRSNLPNTLLMGEEVHLSTTTPKVKYYILNFSGFPWTKSLLGESYMCSLWSISRT